MTSDTWRLTPDNAALIVIDVQERLVAAMPSRDQTIARIGKLLQAAKVMELPALLTLQYVKGLGPLCKELEVPASGIQRFEKMSFSCCGDPPFSKEFGALKRKRVIVCGVETHVCVQQTALDLLESDHQVYVPVDATCSRNEIDCKQAVDRLVRAGTIATTVEAVIFELLREAGTAVFKQMLPLFK